MRLNKNVLILPLLILLMLGACNTDIPDHSKYIPNDAAGVVSINTKQLSKEIAWSYLSGSKLFKEMMKGSGNTDSNSFSPEKSGIDILNTIYMYGRKDARYNTQYNNSGMQIVILLPLDDAKKWEAMITKKMQNEQVTEVNGRKQIKLSGEFVAVWKDKLVVLINEPSNNSGDFNDIVNDVFAANNSIAKDKKFKALQKENHDIAAWINYEIVMQEAMSNNGGMGMLGSFSATQDMFKDAVATFGLDFEKGKVKGNAKYYVSKKMQDLMGNANDKIDNEVLDRLPKENMNMVMSLKVLPKQMLDIIDMMGVKGLVNMELAKQNLTAEEIINAFSGDMAFSMNNFNTIEKPNPYAAYYSDVDDTINMRKYYDYEMDFLYVMKIKNKQTIDKIVALGTDGALITPIGTDSYILAKGRDSIYLIMNKDYLTVSNRAVHGPAYLSGDYKGGSNEGIKYIDGTSVGMYCSLESLLSMLHPSDANDKPTLEHAQKLFKDFKIKSLGLKDGAYQSEMSLNLKDDSENSLLQLINFAGTLD